MISTKGLKIIFIGLAVTFLAESASFAYERRGPVKAIPAALPAPMGPKKTIAVSTFENKAGAWAQWDLGNGMSEMLTTALIRSGRFIVLERPEIQRVIQEQDFGVSGRTAGGEAAQIGKILKSQIMISGAVTEFAAEGGGGGGGFSVKGFTIGANQSVAKVAVNVRIYDTTTGQVLDSQRCEGTAEAGGLSFSYADSNFGMGGQSFDRTPLGKACQEAIDNAVFFITARMQNVPWYGRVVDVKEDGRVFINAGENSGIMAGDVMTVLHAGEELIDPETGASLGSDMTKVGQIQVMQVSEKFSIANGITGGGFQRGDVLRYESK